MLVIALLFLSFFLLNQATESKSASSVTALKLRQRHYFFGDIELTLAKVGFRADCNSRMKFKVVAKAPDWKVIVYRDDDKTYFEESLTQFQDTGLVSGILLSFRDKNIFLDRSPTKVQIYNFPALQLKERNTLFTFMPIDQYACPQVSDLIYGCYKLSVNGGAPLQYARKANGKDMITELDETGNTQILLSTLQISKAMVPTTIFDAPSSYRKAKNMSEVVVSASKRGETDDMQEIFGEDEPAKRKVGKP